MQRWSEWLQGRVALAVVSALVAGVLSVGLLLVTTLAQPAVGSPSPVSTTANGSTNPSTDSQARSGSPSSDDDEHEGEHDRGWSGIVQQVDSSTGNFVLQDRRGATWTIEVTPLPSLWGFHPVRSSPASVCGCREQPNPTIRSLLPASLPTGMTEEDPSGNEKRNTCHARTICDAHGRSCRIC